MNARTALRNQLRAYARTLGLSHAECMAVGRQAEVLMDNGNTPDFARMHAERLALSLQARRQNAQATAHAHQPTPGAA